MTGAAASDDWAALLAPGERILWQGRPDPRPDPAFNLHVPVEGGQRIVLGLILFGLPVLMLLTFQTPMRQDWTVAAAVLALVLPILAGGWYLVLGGKAHVDAFWRRRCRYLLTDRRAVILQRGLGLRRVESRAVAEWNVLTCNGRDPGIVTFHRMEGGSGIRRRVWYSRFAFIPEAARVHALMQRLRDGPPPSG